MNKQAIIQKLANETSPIKDELIEAIKSCPPVHRVMLGSEGKVHTVRIYPMPIFGEPTDGTLFTETADA
jgi:hypothetical protein